MNLITNKGRYLIAIDQLDNLNNKEKLIKQLE